MNFKNIFSVSTRKRILNKFSFKKFCEDSEGKTLHFNSGNYTQTLTSMNEPLRLNYLRMYPNYLEQLTALYQDIILEGENDRLNNEETNVLYNIFINFQNENPNIFSDFMVNKSNISCLDLSERPVLKLINEEIPFKEQIQSLLDKINFLVYNFESGFENNLENIKALVTKLFKLLETDPNILSIELDNLYKFLRNIEQTIEMNPLENSLFLDYVQEILNLKLKILASKDIQTINNSFNFLLEITEYYTNLRDFQGKIVNHENFENNLKTLIENHIVNLISGAATTTDFNNFYNLLAYYYFKKGLFEKCEDYLAKSFEVLKGSNDPDQNNLKLLPIYIQAKVCLKYHNDLKEAYRLLNECYNILKDPSTTWTNDYFKMEIFNSYLEILNLIEGDNRTRSFEVVKYLSQMKIPTEHKSSFHLLITLAKNCEFFGHYRKAYNFYKSAWKIVRFENSQKNVILDSFLRLFNYSDDMKIYSKIFETNINENEKNLKEHQKQLGDFFMEITIHALKEKDYIMAESFLKFLLTYVDNSKNIDDMYLTQFYTLNAILLHESNKLEEALSYLDKAINMIENSTNIKSKENQILLLIRYNFYSAFINLQKDDNEIAIKHYEIFLQKVIELKNLLMENECDQLEYAIHLSFVVHHILARYYKVLEEDTKFSLTITKLNEFLKLIGPKHPAAKFFKKQSKILLI